MNIPEVCLSKVYGNAAPCFRGFAGVRGTAKGILNKCVIPDRVVSPAYKINLGIFQSYEFDDRFLLEEEPVGDTDLQYTCIQECIFMMIFYESTFQSYAVKEP